MTIQSEKIVPILPSLFAGIDVGAEELILVIRKNGTPYKPQKFANTPTDCARLVKKLVNLPGIIVCLEATGVYHFDLSVALHDAGVALMGELLLLPQGLSHREWVKFAGLDPRAFDSGKSVHKKTRISKAGNRHIRSALYMPALSAKQHDPHVKAYFQHLLDNGKLPLQALCAVMRKLLHAIHGILKHDKPFDNARFYAIPA